MRTTIKEVARQAGVSINTVSRVINGRPDVSRETRARVQSAIDQLGYRPNELRARSLLSRRSKTIGHVVPNYANPNVAAQLQAVQTVMSAAGYTVITFDTQEEIALQRTALRALEEKVVDGLILTAASSSDKSLHALSSQIPVVLTNREVEGLEVDRVLTDNALGARLAVDHLVGLGHRSIGYVTSKRDVSPVRDRLAGYRSGLEAAGLAFDPAVVVRTDVSIQAAYEATGALLEERGPRPTAVFAYNDFMAVGVLSALLEHGLKVPDDMAIVGFDDIVYAPLFESPADDDRPAD